MTETRWLIVATDGRHVTLGRAAPPSDEEVARCAEMLAAQGVASAWFVVMTGAYWTHRRVVLEPIREIVAGGVWREAEVRFQAIRRSVIPERPMRASRRRVNGEHHPRPAEAGINEVRAT